MIRHEIWFFFFSLLSGMLLLCAYDQLRVLRRLIPHNGFFQSLEDFFFWTGAGIFCFGVSFRGNQGSLRGFSLAALVFGPSSFFSFFLPEKKPFLSFSSEVSPSSGVSVFSAEASAVSSHSSVFRFYCVSVSDVSCFTSSSILSSATPVTLSTSYIKYPTRSSVSLRYQ